MEMRQERNILFVQERSQSNHSDVLPSPKLGPRWALVTKTVELWGLKGTFLALSTKRGRGAC
jgi:hypothetical protein